MNKLKKAVVMVLALAMVLTCAMVTPVQAAGKLNKKSVSIYETETVSLTVKGVKSVTWKTSNKKIATVDKKGLVKGVKKGTCTVTAKDTKTKAAYSCKVTVKAAKSLGCEFPYKSRVMGTSEPLKPLKAPYMARNPVKWGFFRLKGQEIPLKI